MHHNHHHSHHHHHTHHHHHIIITIIITIIIIIITLDGAVIDCYEGENYSALKKRFDFNKELVRVTNHIQREKSMSMMVM